MLCLSELIDLNLFASKQCNAQEHSHLLDDLINIEQDFWAELAQIQAESIGWVPLDEVAYLHVGSDAAVIQVVGVAKAEMAGSNVLWLL
jgi:hypothetical protein